MTPQNKAKELYDKYFSMIKIESPIDRVSSIPYVKKCALIVVEEIKEAIFWHPYERPYFELEYWNEVMQEIEKL